VTRHHLTSAKSAVSMSDTGMCNPVTASTGRAADKLAKAPSDRRSKNVLIAPSVQRKFFRMVTLSRANLSYCLLKDNRV
jgi:hypothetical protein